MTPFHRLTSVPANSCILLSSREEAMAYPTGDIQLSFCEQCGFIANTAFDPGLTEYSEKYEETQGFSATFNAFQRELAERLIQRHQLYGKHIIEIGCGKGEFLTLVCELGGNRGTGFDPGFRSDRNPSANAVDIEFISDFYSETYCGYKGDFIICKMTLEHISQTHEFVRMIRKTLNDGSDTVVFFQVPDVTRILKDCAFEDIYYEHCSYFSPGSLARLFRKCGFDVIDLTTAYSSQYLMIEARPRDGDAAAMFPLEDDMSALKRYRDGFDRIYREKRRQWQQRIRRIRSDARKAVLWGSGSKAVSFLTTLGVYEEIECVVDINPYRQGCYMAGTGQRIIGPQELAKYRPDLVILMNPVYEDEIRRELSQMDLYPEIVAL